MLQTAEGGIDQISNILTRLKELATQSASDNTTDRTALDNERSYLETEINNIRSNTQYGTTGLLQGGTTVAGAVSMTTSLGIVNIDVTSAAGGAFSLSTTALVAGGTTVTMKTLDGQRSQTVYVGGITSSNQVVGNFSDFGVKVTVNGAVAANNGAFSVTTSSSSFTFQMGDTNDAMNQVSVSIKDFSVTASVLDITVGSNIPPN